MHKTITNFILTCYYNTGKEKSLLEVLNNEYIIPSPPKDAWYPKRLPESH